MKVSPTHLLTIAAAAAALSLAACQRQEEKAAEAPAAAPPPAAEAPPAQAAAPPEQQLAVGPLGNCYDTNNCTPAGNPPPSWGGMTQDQCKAASGAASWREVNRSAQEIGPCVAPP